MGVVLATEAGAAPGGRSALVVRHIAAAIGALATVDTRDVDDLDPHRTCEPGLRQVRLPQTLVAVDQAAHVGLADFLKRTIFTSDLALDAPDIERLIWSSVNTARAIALGEPAWASMQLLPIGEISRYEMPPIRLDAREIDRRFVRIIRHGSGPSGDALATAAREEIESAGFATEIGAGSWGGKAAIHLHIGPAGTDGDEPRIVDGWASGRLVVQLPAPGHAPLVGHETNGLVCDTPDAVASACAEARGDPIFWARLVRAGLATVAPLQRGWADIAAAILA